MPAVTKVYAVVLARCGVVWFSGMHGWTLDVVGRRLQYRHLDLEGHHGGRCWDHVKHALPSMLRAKVHATAEALSSASAIRGTFASRARSTKHTQ